MSDKRPGYLDWEAVPGLGCAGWMHGRLQEEGTWLEQPFHFRYVGMEAAAYIMENDLCLEEFLALYQGAAVSAPASA